ncbi:MAG: hypothetical protein ACLVEL_08805 [Ruthenibacterium sp.]
MYESAETWGIVLCLLPKALPQRARIMRAEAQNKPLCARRRREKRRRGTLKNMPEKAIIKKACVVKKLSKQTPQNIGAKEKEHRYDLFT